MIDEEQAEKPAPSAFLVEVAGKLKKLRESKDMSPEAVATATNGMVSSSYIRRIERCINMPTLETMNHILLALGSNLGLFFEYQIDENSNSSKDAKDRRYRNIVQRALDGADRKEVVAIIGIIEKSMN